MLNLISTPKVDLKGQKDSPEGLKKVQKRPQMLLNEKQKDRTVLSKPKVIVYIGRFQECF